GGEVLDRPAGGTVDDVVPADAQLAQAVAAELHDAHVHQHHRLHADRVRAGEVDHVRVDLRDHADPLCLVGGQLAGDHHLAADVVDPRAGVRAQHLADDARGAAGVGGVDVDPDRALATVGVPEVQRG